MTTLLAAEAPPPPYGAATATAVVEAEAAFALIERGLASLGGQVLGGAVRDDALMASVERIERLVRALTAEKLRRINELTTRSAATGLAPGRPRTSSRGGWG